ncbi:MAG: hypothetical protein ACI8XB_001200 [Patiriisocius sp.]|jgi:hypothetical protein
MFGGSWFGLNFTRTVRNDGPNLVSFDGKIFMSTLAENDTIRIKTSVSNNAIDSIYTVIKSDDIVIDTPADIYESEYQYE